MEITESTPTLAISKNNSSKPPTLLKAWIDKHLIGVMAGAASVSLIFFSGSIWNTWNAYQGFTKVITKQLELQHLSDEIIYLDEVLTMSARMAASTGNYKWEQRYNDHVSPLDQAIKEVIEIAPSYKEDIAKTDQANQTLIGIETQAFQLVREQKPQEALQLLLSPEYDANKQIYSQAIEKIVDNIQAEVEKNRTIYGHNLRLSLIFSGVSFPIFLISWGGVIWAVRSYIKERDTAQQELLKSQTSLLDLNKDLEEKGKLLYEAEQVTRIENETLQNDIAHLLDIVSAVEQGELTVQAEVNERLTGIVADTFNRLIEELAKVLIQVLSTAVQVTEKAQISEQIAQQVAQRANAQSDSVNQILDLSENVQISVNASSQEVQQALLSLSTLQEIVTQGTTAITQLREGIEILSSGNERIIQQMKTLGEFVGLADQFVAEQSEIAQQTQILALNASLVAARAAGQQSSSALLGVAREFEGIAEQVSQLAGATSEGLNVLEQRTQQIHRVVSSVDAEVQNLGNLVEGFREGVQQSRQLFETVETVTLQAMGAGSAVTQANNQIVEATQKTVTAMEDIAGLAQATADLAQNSLVQSEVMKNLSARLLQRIQFFQLPEVAEADNAPLLPPSHN
ncbi:methyl-accepting chemotaxis sensory transducer [Gloeothece citriformis PCC 7424]|uniref:Methyl-accepting chemotaxis sensory transducer n=1 Tax=Gloeothece citriformis (strain PCC 7424) TaxID=65393 RepID=B7KDT7_GLOC7|nr:methyl-accepting chemotaxis protein [Gloeothece citriformis]ACK70389.1 methyl-accepting chemotaxis sensory transducer [Gloeothece citriformis PCC 7424]